MTGPDYEWLLDSHGNTGDARSFLELARELEAARRIHLACTAYDRAFGLSPDDAEVGKARGALLNRLAVREHGITFRYVPAGTFLMGNGSGDPDERPVHPVRLDAFWMSETPISWATYCDLLDWDPPPFGRPKGGGRHFQGRLSPEDRGLSDLLEENKIRMQYCEDATSRAGDWHGHAVPAFEETPDFTLDLECVHYLSDSALHPELRVRLEAASGLSLPGDLNVLDRSNWFKGWEIRAGGIESVFYLVQEQDRLAVYVGGIPRKYMFGSPARDDPRRPWQFDRKPMVSVPWDGAQTLCAHLTTPQSSIRLPTEAEWEKAARGGLVDCLYAWGDKPPTEDRCDCDAFDRFSILPMRRFAPNGYGLYTMNGCVWEWTSDWYDAEFYAHSPRVNPTGPPDGKEKCLRGGSWADCAATVTASFRMSRRAAFAPNIGFRLCRVGPIEGLMATQ